MAGYTKETRRAIEEKWRKRWKERHTYKTSDNLNKPKYYVLDMFPYPSGAGLHVGHPLGYIASDIVARYKRMKGFNVLHPIGFDTFGLPAEQYAIECGIHPAISTQENINNFRGQLDRIGLSYDWSREVQTCDPDYYQWTQWIFLRFFNSWFNHVSQKALPIEELVAIFEREGNANHPFPDGAYRTKDRTTTFSAATWAAASDAKKDKLLMQYRMAYLGYAYVNWCEALGTVLANDEVINGLSYRGGHPIVKRQMKQWYLRITAYAERLLEGLERVDYSHAMKETQRNWIGKSLGVDIRFAVEGSGGVSINVFTTRPDTIFGVDFLTLAPEHDQVKQIATAEQRAAVDEYLAYVASRSEVDRMAEVKKITGCFTGAWAIHPFTQKQIPIWIAEYVLAGYGSGAVMGVPCADERDHRFATYFHLPITNILGTQYTGEAAQTTRDITLENSDFLTGMRVTEAIAAAIERVEQLDVGGRKVNYKMRDSGWSRQRYWGEPFPVVYHHGTPYAMNEKDLPLKLPHTDQFTSPGTGEGPLALLKDWIEIDANTRRDANTMPTHAGAAWYFLRYADPHNKTAFADARLLDYWNQVDIYVGGSEHAVAHLLYARLTVKLLYDLGFLSFDEPFKKLINQGKIMGDSRLVYRIRGENKFVSAGLKDQYPTDPLRIDVGLVDGLELHIEAFKQWRPGLAGAAFILENGKYICGSAAEKMSKSYFNVVNPDHIVESYGADTLRMYEMFLGPLEQSKPWNASGLEGVSRFLKKCWGLFHNANEEWNVSDASPTEQELRILHKTLHKVERDIKQFSFNTSVSEFMICVNALSAAQCNRRAILDPLTRALAPFAPHIAEELWEKLGHSDSITQAPYPRCDEQYLVEQQFTYPISINGKVRAHASFSSDTPRDVLERDALALDEVQKWTEGRAPKKVVVVPGKIINIVL